MPRRHEAVTAVVSGSASNVNFSIRQRPEPASDKLCYRSTGVFHQHGTGYPGLGHGAPVQLANHLRSYDLHTAIISNRGKKSKQSACYDRS